MGVMRAQDIHHQRVCVKDSTNDGCYMLVMLVAGISLVIIEYYDDVHIYFR